MSGSENEVTVWFRTSTGGGIQLSEITFYDANDNQLSVVSTEKPSTNNDGTSNTINLKNGLSESIENTYDNDTSTKWYDGREDLGSVKFTLSGIPSSYTFTTGNDNNPWNRTPITWNAYHNNNTFIEDHTGETNYTSATQQNLFTLPADGTKFSLVGPEPITQANIQTAVNAWIADPTAATTTYGHIKDWYTGAVTNMEWLFYEKKTFNDDISSWNVSNVTTMKGMFYNAFAFNQPLNSWDTSNVTDMKQMFFYSRAFNQNITNWNTTNVTDFTNMFNSATLMIANQGAPVTPGQSYFNQPEPITQANIQTAVDAWCYDPTAATTTYGGHIKDWDTSAVTDMSELFSGKTTFNDDISKWNTSAVTNMDSMFLDAYLFNQDISTKDAGTYTAWDTSNVTSMSNMLLVNQTWSSADGDFNNGQGVGESTAPMNWNTSKVTSFYYLFKQCRKFNQNCSTTSVTIRGVTYNAWDTSNVTDMTRTFAYCESFNNGEPSGSSTKPLYWNTSKVTGMYYMFGMYNFLINTDENAQGIYNQPMNTETVTIGDVTYTAWDVSSNPNMSTMFQDSLFNQPVDNWDTSAWTSMASIFIRTSAFNQPLNSWDTSAVTDMSLMFYNATAFNQPLNSWDTSAVTTMYYMFSNTSAFNQPLNSWDVSSVTNMFAMFYAAAAFNQPLNSWDVSSVTNMGSMLEACPFNQPLNLWDTSAVTNMQGLFWDNAAFNQPLNSWDTSAVTQMDYMFYNATAFNQPIDNFDTSAVTTMYYMFNGATAFNQPLNSWDVSKVTNMGYMFKNASAFNQPLNSWDTSAVTNIDSLFENASSFNQNINTWDVSSVTSMGTTFGGATAFNKPLNLWNTSTVANLGNTFNSATSFNQDIKDWDVSNVTYMANMFDGATVFSRDLARWVVAESVNVTDMFKSSPMGTGGDREPTSDTPPLSYFNQAPCFNQDTLILCPTGNICVKDLKEGDEVVTTSGIKKILRIDSKTRQFNNTGNTSTTMYRMKKTGDMTHDLLVTGNHAILLDDLESYKYYDTMKDCSDESKMITGKHSLIAALCNNFEKETEPKEHTIYHIAIDGDQNRYGLFANGVLMESWDKRQTSM